MAKTNKDNTVELGALFYPTRDQTGMDIPFDTLYIPYIYKEIYFEGVYKDILNQKKDMVIVDVGANIGVTVQHFKDYAKRVYAIEPSPENLAALKKNVEFNKWDNVTVCPYALADKDGEMEFAQAPSNRTTNALIDKDGSHPVGPGGWYQPSFKVPTKTIETFFAENNIDEVDFMKFDPEGSEEMILYSEGFKKVAPKIKSIECEFHHSTWPKIVEHMQSLGFQARRYQSSAIIVLFFR
jgi:FkbM family methyltransferase